MFAARATFLCFRAGIFGWIYRRTLTVISGIEPRAFKDYTRAAADEALYFFTALRAFFQRLVIHPVKSLKGIPAFGAFIIVRWHIFIPDFI
jgi:hypothetical protein